MEQGKGTKTFSSGDVYVGEWDLGMEQGKGTITYRDGSVWDGEWDLGSKKPRAARAADFAAIDPKKYWEGAFNCFRYTDNPLKNSQRPYIEELLNAVDSYKSGDKIYKHDIIEYSTNIVENLGCSLELFE